MAFYPAHCDNNCKGCEKNTCGWCIWKDRATPEYRSESFANQYKVEGKGKPIFEGWKISEQQVKL